MGSFGEKFREERERRGFTLDDISNATKISSRMLQAIEQEHFDVLPGGVFNKGFVRAYAKLLGFNDQEAVAGYLTALRQAQLDAQNVAWDQPPPRAAMAPATSAPLNAHTKRDSKLAEPAASSPSSNWSIPKPLVSVPIPAQSVPTSSSPPESGGPHAMSNETSERESQVPPLVVAPLWISPPLSSSSPAKSLPIPPPLVSPPPLATAQVPLASPPASSSSEPTLHSESASDVAHFSPQILAEKPSGRQKREISLPVAVPVQRPGAQWKIPLAIVGLGVVVVAALLWGRHPHPAPPKDTAAITTNASPSSTPVNSNPSPSSTSEANATPKIAGNKAAGNNSTEHAVSPTESMSHSAAPSSAVKKPLLTAPFRVAIRASENCWISVTADGELVARENLIAPATTSVKASRELVVQVSNPAGVSFRWNDRTISAENGGSGTKTFVFDNSGLRTTP